MTELNQNKRDNVGIHVTLRRVRITIVAVEKQEVIHILSVCLSLIIQHVKRMRRIVLSPVACMAVPYFHTYLISGTLFGEGGGNVWNMKCVF